MQCRRDFDNSLKCHTYGNQPYYFCGNRRRHPGPIGRGPRRHGNGNSYQTARVFQGSLADVRVWTKARTAAQIAAYYDKSATGKEDGLVGWWPFDQDASTTRVLNRKNNNISKYIPTGATWGNGGVPLLAAPDLVEESEQAATPSALRTSCDTPEGKSDATARRNDAFAALAAMARFGFGNEFYFSRFFRRHYGLPPSKWRNQCRI